MSKYQINYNRVAPDHRVPFDYVFVKKTQSLGDYYKYWKQGFNTSWLKYYHIHLAGIWTLLAIGTSMYVFWGRSADDNSRDKVGKYPALHFLNQYKKGNTAAYDNILSKYVTDPFGNKDQPFEQL